MKLADKSPHTVAKATWPRPHRRQQAPPNLKWQKATGVRVDAKGTNKVEEPGRDNLRLERMCRHGICEP